MREEVKMERTVIRDALIACRQSFVAVAVFSAVANVLMLTPAFFMLNIYDKAVANNSLSTLWVLSFLAIFLFIVLGAMEALRSRVLVAISSRLDRLLAGELHKITFETATRVGSHRLGTQPLTDLNSLRHFLTGTAVFAIFDAPWLPIYLFVLFLFHPLLGWLGVFAAFLLLAIAVINQRKVDPPLEVANELSIANNSATQRALRNSDAVAAMGMLPVIQAQWRERQDNLLSFQEKASNTAGIFNAITKTLRLAVQSAAIAAGAFLVLRQEISPGMLIAGSILVGRALQPVELAVGAWKGFSEAKNQYQRLTKVLEVAPQQREKMELPPIAGHVSAKNASVVPPGERRITLQNVTLDIPAGTVCMVVGPSGAGKSTFLKALLGLWPTAAGEIRVDGTEPSKFDRAAFGPQLGYLPQDIELLEGTVAQNITRFGDIDSEAVIAAAHDAGIHDFILSLAEGYETELGPSGAQLSPGQRQRVALARALYRNPKLVVLDEPNSNLDDSGESALHAAIKKLKDGGSTVVIVSHRQGVLPLSDYVLVLTAGKVKNFQSTKELVARIEESKKENQKKPASNKPKPTVQTIPAASLALPSTERAIDDGS